MAQKRSWTTSSWVGGIIGVFAGGLTILLLERLGHLVLGTADPSDLSTVTTPMFLSVLVAWVAGAAVAGLVATAWSRTSSLVPGTVVGLILLAGSISNMMVIPHPGWMMVGAVVLMPAASIGAARTRIGRAT